MRPTRDPRGAGALAAACAGLLMSAAPGAAQDPLVASGAQSWLPRVVPAGVAAPAGIPPIAIVEDGFDPTHPDMQGGWVVVRRPPPPAVTADEVAARREAVDHGTAVASVIGAPRNGAGIEGVLPGARVWVYGSSPYCRDVAAAVRQAVRDGVRVINMSIGFERAGACAQLRDAVSFAYGRGVLTVASSGNARPAQRWQQPGSDWHVLTVGALNAFDQTTSFSQQTIAMDLTAPGEGVLAAVPVARDPDGVPDGYTLVDGTSFSTPMVAAAAAWVMAARPDLSASQVADVLRLSARDLGRPGWDRAYGWGHVDIAAALAEPAPLHDPLEPNEDIRWVTGRAGFTADRPLLTGRRREDFRATLDVAEDPFDIYPVRVPVGRRARITVRPAGIHVDLLVLQPTARSAGERGQVVVASRRPGTATEQVTVVNPRATRPAFIEVRIRRGGDLGGRYRITVEVLR